MSTETLSLVLASIQTGIIIVSIFILLYQVRQFNDSLNQDSYGKQLDFSLRINEFFLHNRSIADQFYQNNLEYKSLNDAQKDFYNYLTLAFCLYERFYLLFRSKRIDKKAWEAWERWLVDVFFRLDLFQVCWKNERLNFHEDFRRYLDTKYEEQQHELSQACQSAQ